MPRSCTILLLNTPKECNISINYHYYKITPQNPLKGIKNLFLEPLLFQYSTTQTSRSTLMLFPQTQHESNSENSKESKESKESTELFVLAWNYKVEKFILETDKNQINRILFNWNEFESFLAVYPNDNMSHQWSLESKYLKKRVLERVGVCSGAESESRFTEEWSRVKKRDLEKVEEYLSEVGDGGGSGSDGKVPSSSPEPSLETRIEELKDKDEKNYLNFTLFDLKKSYPPNSTPTQITKHSLDKSYLLSTILSTYNSPTDIISEYHYCFLLFWIGGCFDAFEQYKQLTILFCNCKDAIKQYPFFFTEYIKLLEWHLQEWEVVGEENVFLVKCYSTLVENVVDCGAVAVVDLLKGFIGRVDGKFEWNLKSLFDEVVEHDEDAPVVVNI